MPFHKPPVGKGPAGGGPAPKPGKKAEEHLRVGAPNYIGNLSNELAQCPPGHKFRLYFSGWEENWRLTATKRKEVLDKCAQIPPAVQKQIDGLLARQKAVASGADFLILTAKTNSPFTTGLGNEHPLENGFSFLDPYGVPYLPGSGVKGALRRAAEELALFENESYGWSIPAVWWLLGFDGQAAYFRKPEASQPQLIQDEVNRWRDAYTNRMSQPDEAWNVLLHAFCDLVKSKAGPMDELKASLQTLGDSETIRIATRHAHMKGALHFFDVIPRCPKNLRADIMNPHYGHYYQGGEPPGDWGAPVPIFFLTLPAGTEFTFVVRYAPPPNWPPAVKGFFEAEVHGTPRWKDLISNAFAFAWEWQGFGAKTSVGYGRFATSTGR